MLKQSLTIKKSLQNFLVKCLIIFVKLECICLSVIVVDYIFKSGKNYCAQIFLEGCKYIIKEKKVITFIGNDADSADSVECNDDSAYSDSEEDFEKILDNLQWHSSSYWWRFDCSLWLISFHQLLVWAFYILQETLKMFQDYSENLAISLLN